MFTFLTWLNDRDVNGDASEAALLKCVESIVGNTTIYRSKFPKVAEVPFNSSNKYQVNERVNESCY